LFKEKYRGREMKKNKRTSSTPSASAPRASAGQRPMFNKKSLKCIGAGILALVIGYAVLSFADSKAQNIPGKLSPFLILGGYALIGIGLFVREK
jgi:hypothetical protein